MPSSVQPADHTATQSKDAITVCICTYRRAEDLTALLASLQRLEYTPAMEVQFCVVDNDTEPSARRLVEQAALDFPRPLRYVHETDPGIPSARNRALNEAIAPGYLAFLDDDETADQQWLIELHRVAKATGASFVQGPVQMHVEDPKDQWWLDTVMFKQKVFPDQSARHESWTNNVMIDMDFVRRTGCRFDAALRFDGGSDTLFFQDLIRHGGHGVWAAHALVFERQPKSRLQWNWTMQRQFRYGTTRANTMKLRKAYPVALAYCVVRSGAMVLVGLGCLCTAVVRGRKGLADGVAYLSRATGVLLGGVGVRKLEYARKSANG